MKLRSCQLWMKSLLSRRVLCIRLKPALLPNAGKKKLQRPEPGTWQDLPTENCEFVSDRCSCIACCQPQQIEKTLCSLFQRLATRTNHVQASMERLRVDDLNGAKFRALQLAGYRQLR